MEKPFFFSLIQIFLREGETRLTTEWPLALSAGHFRNQTQLEFAPIALASHQGSALRRRAKGIPGMPIWEEMGQMCQGTAQEVLALIKEGQGETYFDELSPSGDGENVSLAQPKKSRVDWGRSTSDNVISLGDRWLRKQHSRKHDRSKSQNHDELVKLSCVQDVGRWPTCLPLEPHVKQGWLPEYSKYSGGISAEIPSGPESDALGSRLMIQRLEIFLSSPRFFQ